MGHKNHNPSIARQILRNLKRGQSPEDLLPLTKNITDSYYQSLSFFYLASYNFANIKESQRLFKLGFNNIDRVKQNWRRIELLGKISKILKQVQTDEIKNIQYNFLLETSLREKREDTREFFVKNIKNFPASMLHLLLKKAVKLKGYEFDSSKAVIRSWINKGETKDLIAQVSELNVKIKIKLLGYLHLQFHKSNIKSHPTALEWALKENYSEEDLTYLVRVCSSPSDLNVIAEQNLSPEVILALAVRADRKGWSDLFQKFVSEAENEIDSLESSERKERLLSKLKTTIDRSEGNISLIESQSEKFIFDLAKKGKHTLGLFNMYGGSWNHPHFKAVHKASKLCAAFDLNLALIAFPQISSDKLIKEVRKEMQISSNDFLEALFSLERVNLFEKDIDESLVGKKILTTANPESSKLGFPDGKLCMIMVHYIQVCREQARLCLVFTMKKSLF